MPTDNVLKLYSKTIQSSFLHYGFWELDEAIDLSNWKAAQEKYTDFLFKHIKKNINHSILFSK